MKLGITLASLFAAAAALLTAPTAHVVKITGPRYSIDGKPIQIISGEMHYARIPREYWRDRMRKARAMGLNTIATYVFWNLHEPRPGVFNFSGQLDVAAFVKTAQEEGLYVLLRPGPYVCSEWDLGGMPAWLLADPNIVLRSPDPQFMNPAREFLKKLGEQLAPLQASHGGPIIGVQVENEYGSFGKDAKYMDDVRNAIVAAGLSEVPLFTADGPDRLAFGTLPDVQAAINFGPGDAQRAFSMVAKFRPDGLRMNQEYWDGWFDAWGKPHETTNAEREARELDWMLGQGFSVNLYMFHGGTTFGFMNGANFDRAYSPQTTSYDYNSPLDEAGAPTQKFFMFRRVIADHLDAEKLPPLPPEIPRTEIPEFTLTESSSLWANLGAPREIHDPQPMEMLGQSYGYILYRTTLRGPANGELAIHELHDYAQIYLDSRLIGTLDRRHNEDHLPLNVSSGTHTLDILVENTGRINFGPKIRDDRKGITQSVTLGDAPLTGWQAFCLPMDDFHAVRFSPRTPQTTDGPAFYRGYFDVSQTGDTFLDMRAIAGKGAVWVNGHALGRYWNIGPQQTLYLPGPWLKKGRNEVIFFDLFPRTSPPQLRGITNMIRDQLAISELANAR